MAVDPGTARAVEEPSRPAEDRTERALFASRWVLLPMYLGLIGALLVLAVKFLQAFWHLVSHAAAEEMKTVTLGVLELLDITLLANLVLIIVFAGYENFVSKIGAARDSEDRPSWMGKVDYSGLKIKLIGSLVAISVISLLQDFLNVQPETYGNLPWRIAIHITFVISGVLFAVMDYVADKRALLGDHR
ncbi:TIGR00645 family protein [Klenkia sp. LSe6-5]|uniref:UPF0114 protein TEK04_14970 n=1 Tax=Klenkia sesuvii TaxID=3103137 RepID=A0ABU8DWL2_9ACTN